MIKKKERVSLSMYIGTPPTIIDAKLEDGWSFGKIYAFIRQEEISNIFDGVSLFNNLLFLVGERGLLLERAEIEKYYSTLVSEKYTEEELEHTISRNRDGYDRYVKDTSKKKV